MTRLPVFWRRFYLRQAVLLAVAALALGLLFHFTRLDLRLADPWFDPATGRWPLQDAWWTSVLVHRWLKFALMVAAVACIVMAWRTRHDENALGWRLVAAASVAVPLLVSLGKRVSPMHCPWLVDRYGGDNPYFDLFTQTPHSLVSMGHCFPAAFVSSASWLLAFVLFDYPRKPRTSVGIGIAALVFSLALGWVHQMRGAHFLSHTLWSLWLSWAIILLLHALLGLWRRPLPSLLPRPQGATFPNAAAPG